MNDSIDSMIDSKCATEQALLVLLIGTLLVATMLNFRGPRAVSTHRSALLCNRISIEREVA